MSKSDQCIHTLIHRINCRMFPDDPVDFIVDHFLHKLRNIMIIIVKGIAVHPAVLHNVRTLI